MEVSQLKIQYWGKEFGRIRKTKSKNPGDDGSIFSHLAKLFPGLWMVKRGYISSSMLTNLKEVNSIQWMVAFTVYLD